MFPRKLILHKRAGDGGLSKSIRDEVSNHRRRRIRTSQIKFSGRKGRDTSRRLTAQTGLATSEPTSFELSQWLKRHAINSTSYILLEGGKQYFTVPSIDGFIGYQVNNGVVIIGGDPVCAKSDADALIGAFVAAMKGKPVAAYQVSPDSLAVFRNRGFRDIQIGKEAVFDLEKFTLRGGAMELVRAAVNKAERAGVVVTEHLPFARGSEQANDEIKQVSDQWLNFKGSEEMGFLLGSLGLDTPSAKRYFIARSGNGRGRIEGFIVCAPIYGRKGYYLDMTRRRVDAVRGTMELLTSQIMTILRNEGYVMASMGLAPLAMLDDEDLVKHPRLTRLMRYTYDRLHSGYDFKFLYRYKAKYHPHSWEPRYLCFNRERMSIRMASAIISVRRPFRLSTLITRRNLQTHNSNGRIDSYKRAASFVVGLCSALFWSS